MRINIISGPMASGKTTKLRSIQAELERQGIKTLLTYATAYPTTQSFLRRIARELELCRTVLLDDCNQKQIDAINHWKKETDRDGQFEDAVIHVVRGDF